MHRYPAWRVETEDVDPRPCSARRACAASLPYATLDQTTRDRRENHEAPSSSKLAAKPRSETFGKSAVRSPQESRGEPKSPPPIFRFSVVLSLLYIYTRGKKEVRAMSEAMVTGRMTTEKKAPRRAHPAERRAERLASHQPAVRPRHFGRKRRIPHREIGLPSRDRLA